MNDRLYNIAQRLSPRPLPQYLGKHFPEPRRMVYLAEYHEMARHAPNDPDVKESYRTLIADTNRQFWALREAGYSLVPWIGAGQPYEDSEAMINDVTHNSRLYYFTGGDLPDDHWLKGVPNQEFRAVHDLFGHAMHGYGFGPVGEFNAWLAHDAMFSPAARPALAAETLAQNAWFNYGPHKNAPVTQRPYAPQKCYLGSRG